MTTSTLRTIIVDDEPLARRGLELRLKQIPDILLVAQCRNGREAVDAINRLKPDLMFLDVQMPGMDGFEVLKKTPEDLLPVVIFVTAFDQYAINAFQANAVDYLLKPIEESRLHQALFRVRERREQEQALNHRQKLLALIGGLTGQESPEVDDLPTTPAELLAQAHSGCLSIKDGGCITRVSYSEITHIDAAGDYMCVHADDDTHILRATMKELEEQLNPAVFTRVHRSTIVNIDAVREARPHINGEHYLLLRNGDTVKLSRSYKDKIARFS